MKKGQGWARRVTKSNLSNFVSYLRSALVDEEEPVGGYTKRNLKQERSTFQSPFQGRSFKLRNRFKRAKIKRSSYRKDKAISKGKRAEKIKPLSSAGEKGRLLWRKVLTKSDAQVTSGNTNPTGCLRFTKAPTTNPSVIDQTTYFRNDLFGNYKWDVINDDPFEEVITVPFYVTINDKFLGLLKFNIQHKPSGEAGQHNYTTSLHWGDHINKIRKMVKPGQMFSLYGPTAGSKESFFIVIS